MDQNSGGRLYVIGMGVKIPRHSTVEALRVLGRCDEVFTMLQETPESWLPAIRKSSLVVHNLMKFYTEGAVRSSNYDRVASMILSAVRTTEVAYVTYGNPLAYDSVAQTLVRRGAEAGMTVEVFPGISSVDTLLCDLGIDMAPGLQIYEASWLVATQTPLVASTALILVQLGTYGSLRAHYQERRSAGILQGLVDYLGRTYPVTHGVALVRSSATSAPAFVRRLALGDLPMASTDDILGASLYIPAVFERHFDENQIEMPPG